jgi:hypothetical protein
VIVTYVYQLVDGEVSWTSSIPPFLTLRFEFGPGLTIQVRVDKVEYRRPDPPKDETSQVPRQEVPAGW